jgi:hypothetical protein
LGAGIDQAQAGSAEDDPADQLPNQYRDPKPLAAGQQWTQEAGQNEQAKRRIHGPLVIRRIRLAA